MFRAMLAALMFTMASASAHAAVADRSVEPVTASVAKEPGAGVDQRATEISQGLSEVTGLGISPLMTMCVLSLIEWWTHDPAEGPVPWHGTGWFAWSLFAIVVLGLLLKLFGSGLPAPVQKFQRAFEHQSRYVTGLIAAGVFVPMVATTMQSISPGAAQASAGMAMEHLSPQAAGLGQWSATATALLIMGLAWTVSQGIESLIFLSPFPLLDGLLITLRGVLLGLIATAAAFAKQHPMLVSLPILCVMLVVFAMVAGWCVRLNGFVGTYALDILLRRWRRPEMAHGPYLAFLGRGSGLAPARVRCHVERVGPNLVIRWRRWFVGPIRQGRLQPWGSTLVRGIMWPEIDAVTVDGRRFWLWLPPRYRAHQEAVTASLRIHARDGAVLRGWSKVKAFFAGLGAKPAVPVTTDADGAASGGSG